MNGLYRDLLAAARGVARRRIWAAGVVFALALGIAANAATFGAADSLLFRALPFRHPRRIVALENANGTFFGDRASRTQPDLLDWTRLTGQFSGVGVYAVGAGSVAGTPPAERVSVALITPGVFSLLGVAPTAGRPFSQDDDLPGNDQVAIVSDRLSRRRFGRRANVIGRSIRLNARRYVVVGVMPRGFSFPSSTDVWIPLSVPFDVAQLDFVRTVFAQTVVARLRPGVTLPMAQAAVDATVRRVSPDAGRSAGATRIVVTPLQDVLTRSRRSGLLLLEGMSAIVFLLACATTTSLLLARALGRLHEIRTRLALGAPTPRVFSALMAEPLLLACGAGAVGVLLDGLVGRLLGALGIDALEHWAGPTLWRFFLLAFALTLASGLACGLATAAIAIQTAAARAAAPVRTPGLRAMRGRRALLVAQVALAIVLVAATALVGRSLDRLLSAEDGVHGRAITGQVSLPVATYATPARQVAYAAAWTRAVRARADVQFAGVVSDLPLSGNAEALLPFVLHDASGGGAPRAVQAQEMAISPGYLGAMGLQLLRGRGFRPSDGAGAAPVALIDEQMAQRYWPRGGAIGAFVSHPGGGKSRVIGVVQNVRTFGLSHPAGPEVYLPFAQRPTRDFTLVAYSPRADPRLESAMIRAARSFDASVPVYAVRTMAQVRLGSVTSQRNRALVLALFSILAIALAALGVYGMASFLVAERTPELGLRLALGAAPRTVLRLVVQHALRTYLLAVPLGIVLSALAARAARRLLFGIAPIDPVSLAAAVVIVVGCSLAASLLPGWRATRIDPATALRRE